MLAAATRAGKTSCFARTFMELGLEEK